MNARDEILETVRAAGVDPFPHPGTPEAGRPTGAPRDDLAAAFARAVEATGGVVVKRPVATVLKERFPGARIASTVAGVDGSVELEAVVDPHELADLDVLVCRGVLGVAENGAVWLPESAMGHRAAPFLAQHMVVVLARDAIVADLHGAYDALDVDGPAFGLFVAGPSKTADIEQSLVMGAHGPRSLAVVLVGGDGS